MRVIERLAKILLPVVLAACSVAAVWYLVVVPWRCDLVCARTENRTRTAFSNRVSDQNAHILARTSIDEIKPCLESDPTNVALYMIEAANFRILNRPEDAIAVYSRALQYDRRPELFLNLGLVQLETGRREEAIRNLELAVRFNPHVDSEIRAVDTFLADELARRTRV